MQNLLDCLEARGLVDAKSSEELRHRLATPITLYLGFDPTADSLHLGHFLGIVVLAWFQKYGHTPVVLLGGATGRIGDPSGKSLERPLLDSKEITKNIRALRGQFEKILNSGEVSSNPVKIVDNYEWLGQLTFVDFLRDIGKHFRLSSMLAKESVRARLESEEGISFTEFSYQILQAYDFHHLFSHQQVELQIGGSDQWGNITAGLELIRKLEGKGAYGLTFPLLTRSDGKKFGKSESGAVWLDSEKFSSYQLYQYLFSVPDADVIGMLKMLTFIDLEEIAELEKNMALPSYLPNTAQRRLAEALTLLIHGEEGLQRALEATQKAAPGGKTELTVEVLETISKEVPFAQLKKEVVLGGRIDEFFVKLGLSSSKSELHKLIKNGGAYLNNQKIEDPFRKVFEEDLIQGRFLLLAVGKKKKGIISIL